MNNKINKIMTGISIVIIVISAAIFISLAKSTYSVSDKYVIFKGVGQHNEEIVRSCKIGTDGKLASSCLDEINRICGEWSKEKFPGRFENNTCVQTGRGTSPADLKTMTFSDSDTYYCVGCTSRGLDYDWGCYVCDGNSSIMQWVLNTSPSDSNCPNNKWHKDTSITDDKQCPPPPPENACYECKNDSTVMEWRNNGNADSKCSAGYNKTTKTQAQCKYTPPENACYECKNDSTVMEWRNNGNADSKCSAGYNKTTKTQAQCKYTPPENACYECKNDSTVMEWRDNGNADSKCSAGYNKTTKTQAQCKYTPPQNACYECKTDKNIMKWKDNALGDNSCPGGYNKTTKTKAQCKVEIPENPPTGQTQIILTWIVASIAIGCSLWYLKKSV